MSDAFESDPEFNALPPKSRPARGSTVIMRLADLVEIVIKVISVLGVIMILIALFTGPAAYRSAREAAIEAGRRAQCISNLKQIALALNNYEQAYDALPPAYTVDAEGRRLHSWRTLILPYLDEGPLYKSIDLAKPWSDPANAKALATSVSFYRCPERHSSASGGPPLNTTTYLAIVAPGGCFDPTRPRRLEEITDGASSTLMVIEAGEEDAVPWMAPVDADEALVTGFGPTTKVHHPGGVNACLVDGSVRFLKTSISAKTLRALMSIAGGEVVNSDAY